MGYISAKNRKIFYYAIPGFYTFKTRISPEGFHGFNFHSYGYFITTLPILTMYINDILSALLGSF